MRYKLATLSCIHEKNLSCRVVKKKKRVWIPFFSGEKFRCRSSGSTHSSPLTSLSYWGRFASYESFRQVCQTWRFQIRLNKYERKDLRRVNKRADTCTRSSPASIIKIANRVECVALWRMVVDTMHRNQPYFYHDLSKNSICCFQTLTDFIL